MTTEQLKCFLEVAKYNNFTKAAQHLYINQSTVSRQIAEIEKELGAKLFTRSGGNVMLTEAGVLFFKEGGDILRKYEAVKERISAIGSGRGGKLTIGLPANIFGKGVDFLPAHFAEEYPNTEFRIVMMNTVNEINTAITCGDIDVGISFDFLVDILEEEVEIKHLRRTSFVLFAREKNPIPSPIEKDDLLFCKLILLKADHQLSFMNQIIGKIAYGGGQNLFFCPNYESMLMEVSMGDGIGILPEAIFEKYKDLYNLKRVDVKGLEGQGYYVFVYNKRNINPMIQPCYKMVLKHFKE